MMGLPEFVKKILSSNNDKKELHELRSIIEKITTNQSLNKQELGFGKKYIKDIDAVYWAYSQTTTLTSLPDFDEQRSNAVQKLDAAREAIIGRSQGIKAIDQEISVLQKEKKALEQIQTMAHNDIQKSDQQSLNDKIDATEEKDKTEQHKTMKIAAIERQAEENRKSAYQKAIVVFKNTSSELKKIFKEKDLKKAISSPEKAKTFLSDRLEKNSKSLEGLEKMKKATIKEAKTKGELPKAPSKGAGKG